MQKSRTKFFWESAACAIAVSSDGKSFLLHAFDLGLVEERTNKLQKLACPAFNADFGRYKIGLHVPLSFEAQAEARLLKQAANKYLSLARGYLIIMLSQYGFLIDCYNL